MGCEKDFKSAFSCFRDLVLLFCFSLKHSQNLGMGCEKDFKKAVSCCRYLILLFCCSFKQLNLVLGCPASEIGYLMSQLVLHLKYCSKLKTKGGPILRVGLWVKCYCNFIHISFSICIQSHLTGGRLTEIHLIEIVFFQLIESFNNEHLIFYHLIKFFETFQLIKIL